LEDLFVTVEELVGINKKERLRAEIDEITLNTLMNTDVVSIAPNESINNALKKMRDLDLHDLPVSADGKRLMGVVSYGTLLRRKNLSIETKVETIMVTPQNVTPDMPLTEVAELFINSGYRQVPVMSNERMVGVISRSDLLGVVQGIRELRDIPVAEIMSPHVKTVKLEDRVLDAVTIMRNMDVRVLPVTDGQERLIGVVGIKDIANYNWAKKDRATTGEIIGENRPAEVEVGSVLVEPAITTGPTTTLGEAVKIMLDRNISSLPVVDKGTLLGIVTKYDIVELIASLKQRNVVYTQISGLGEDDRFSLDMMSKEIEISMKKISPIETPMLFALHVGRYNDVGTNFKYTLHARLITNNRVYTGSSVGWDLIQVTAELMQNLERRIIEHKEERIRHRRRSRNIGHD
jgi:CBS domain-containing protein